MKARLPVTPWEWGVAAFCALGALLLIILVAWYLNAPQRAAEARAGGILAEEHGKAAADAGRTIDAAHNAATANETLSRENADAIRAANGASQPLDPDLNRVARERLCARAAYRGRPECVQLLGPAEPSR